MPNKGRGEVELEVDGRTYVLRPSFETMAAIESALDISGSELMTKGRNDPSSPKLIQMVTVLHLAIKGTKENKRVPTIARFGESMRRELGVTGTCNVMMSFLVNSILSDAQREKIEAQFAEDEDDDKDKESDPSEPSEPTPSQSQ